MVTHSLPVACSPPSLRVGHQVWLVGGGKNNSTLNPPQPQKAKQVTVHFHRIKGLQISGGPVLPQYQRGLGVHVSVAAGEHEQHWAIQRS